MVLSWWHYQYNLIKITKLTSYDDTTTKQIFVRCFSHLVLSVLWMRQSVKVPSPPLHLSNLVIHKGLNLPHPWMQQIGRKGHVEYNIYYFIWKIIIGKLFHESFVCLFVVENATYIAQNKVSVLKNNT